MKGSKFGRWTCQAQYIMTERGERKWFCRCECGTKRYVLERSLKSGGSRSCGCLRKEAAVKAVSLELTGQTFGELTVLKRAECSSQTEERSRASAGSGIRWLCRCSCGSQYEVAGTLLVTGRRTHCGGPCHQKNYISADITGQKFRRLTALHPTEKRTGKGNVIWHCRCDCGNEVDISYNDLMYTGMQSCGCQKKEHDRNLQNLQTHVAGTTIELLQSRKIPKDNTTGYRGVYLIRGKYVAKINFQKKTYYLGSFDKIEAAAEARKEAEMVLFDGTADHYCRWKQRAETDSQWAAENPVEIRVSQDSLKRLSVEFFPRTI